MCGAARVTESFGCAWKEGRKPKIASIMRSSAKPTRKVSPPSKLPVSLARSWEWTRRQQSLILRGLLTTTRRIGHALTRCEAVE